MEEILLPAGYTMTHRLVHIKDNLWRFEFDASAYGSYRLIAFDGENTTGQYVYAFDPEGGPFLHVDQVIKGYIIKSITNDGIFELIKDNQNENN